ncbi:MAG TPA: diaminopimelate epimerase [Burkholderiales bacterium]|nr:diaminopimelate epimerase [Burkholderiales bacterium]
MNNKINFIKMQGLGNDFILIDKITEDIDLDSKHIKFLCNRKFGIGCDQLLIIEKSIDPLINFNYKIFNQDGKEAQHCANGARCVIKYLVKDKLISNDVITLGTRNRIISGFVLANGDIKLSLGEPEFSAEKIPFIHKNNTNNKYSINIENTNINLGIVSMGNPHAIICLNNKNELNNTDKLSKIARLLQQSKYFPESVNINFYYVKDKSTIFLRTYERGCGFTLSCGTGAAATVCYAIKQNEVEKETKVIMQGGVLTLIWENKEVFMIGTAEEVYRGTIDIKNINFGITELSNFEERIFS